MSILLNSASNMDWFHLNCLLGTVPGLCQLLDCIWKLPGERKSQACAGGSSESGTVERFVLQCPGPALFDSLA